MTDTINPDNSGNTLDSFYEYLREVFALYQHLVPMLQEEFDFILRDDFPALDENMKAQQALLLRTRPFDRNIAEYQSKLGIAGSTLSEMASGFPEGEGARFSKLLSQFRETMEEVDFYRDKCKSLLQSRLYHIEKILSRTEMQKDNTTYDQNAAGVRSSLISKAFETKI